MASDGGDFWKAIVAAIPGLGALGWAVFRQLDDKNKNSITITHERDDEDSAAKARANLDDAQKEWFDGMRADLREQREARREAEKEAEIWEGRARRADRGWLNLRHQILEERITGIRKDLPDIPRLEDPLI